MKQLLYLVLLIVFIPCLKAQDKYFNKQYDYNNTFESFASVAITEDSGFIAVGFGGAIGRYILNIVRTDKEGNVLWNRIYPPDSITENSGTSIITLSNDNYLITGDYIEHDGSSSTRTNRDVYLIKINGSGDTIWTKRFGLGIGTAANPDFESANKVIQTSDSGFALFGYSSNFSGGKWQMYLIKTDSSGNKQWEKNYGGTEHDGGMDILQLPDGGYFLVGYTDSYGIGTRNWYLVRTDNIGNQQWQKTYGTIDYNVAGCIISTENSSYLISGGMFVSSTDAQGAIVKIDSLGSIMWEKRYGGNKVDSFEQLIKNQDGSIIAVGASRSFSSDGKDDGWAIKTDSAGSLIWERVYSKDNGINDYFYDIKSTSDNGFVLCGQTRDNSNGTYQNGWLVKTDCLGCDSLLCYYPASCDVLNEVEVAVIKNEEKFVVFPNPTSSYLNISYSINTESNSELRMYDVFGKLVKVQTIQTASGELSIDLSELSSGIYQIILSNENQLKVKSKVVLNK